LITWTINVAYSALIFNKFIIRLSNLKYKKHGQVIVIFTGDFLFLMRGKNGKMLHFRRFRHGDGRKIFDE
jgi:hypothetical protein